MRNFKNLYLKQYDCKLTFIVTDDTTKENIRLNKKYKIQEQVTGNSSGFVFWSDMDQYYLVLHLDYIDKVNVRNHELFHLVKSICQPRCIDEEESQALLMGYLSEELYNFLNNKGHKILFS